MPSQNQMKTSTKRSKIKKALAAIAYYSLVLFATFTSVFFMLYGTPKQVPHDYLLRLFGFLTIALVVVCSSALKGIGRKGALIIEALTAFCVVSGLIPIIEAFLQFGGKSLNLVTIYAIDSIFILTLSTLILYNSLRTVTISLGFGFIPHRDLKRIIFSKIVYYSGSYANRELTRPIVGFYSWIRTSPTLKELSENLEPLLKTTVCCSITKDKGEHQLKLDEISFDVKDTRIGESRDIYAQLERVNVYLDGRLSSSIIFYDDIVPDANRVSVPIINYGTSSIRFWLPIAVGIGKGKHTVAFELFDSSGKILDIVNIGFAVFDWMREEETWSIIPTNFTLSGMKEVIPTAIYSKTDKLPEGLAGEAGEEADKITIASIKVNTSSIKNEPDKRRVNSFEVALETLDSYYLNAIDITIDGDLNMKFGLTKEELLMKEHSYVLKLPPSLPLDLALGKHTLLLRLFGGKSQDEKRELLTFVKDFNLIHKRSRKRGSSKAE